MFSLTSAHQFYLYSEPTDMRKSFDALSGIIVNTMNRTLVTGDVFMFINKSRNKIKLLHWEPGGLVLYYKRLEQGTLELPTLTTSHVSVRLHWSDLIVMIEGIALSSIKRHKRYTGIHV